jgi:hypothetical protein
MRVKKRTSLESVFGLEGLPVASSPKKRGEKSRPEELAAAAQVQPASQKRAGGPSARTSNSTRPICLWLFMSSSAS